MRWSPRLSCTPKLWKTGGPAARLQAMRQKIGSSPGGGWHGRFIALLPQNKMCPSSWAMTASTVISGVSLLALTYEASPGTPTRLSMTAVSKAG